MAGGTVVFVVVVTGVTEGIAMSVSGKEGKVEDVSDVGVMEELMLIEVVVGGEVRGKVGEGACLEAVAGELSSPLCSPSTTCGFSMVNSFGI